MKRGSFRFISLIFGIILVMPIGAWSGDSPLRIFGYFQTEFRHDNDSGIARNSFLMQQLNLFLQKDLGRDWTSFVNFEIVNSYSSSRDWGSFNLEEAWVSYRFSDQFKLKIGLQIPEFNNLNTIKNRTPLLPYIIRPFVYETSFSEFFDLDIVTPARAFVQTYGTIPSKRLKIDHAFYVGNSLNVRTGMQVNSESENAPLQSGTDTTDTFMFGGRVGIRYGGLKTGISATHEKLNAFAGTEHFLGTPASRYVEMPLTRIGTDLSLYWKDFVLESEYINTKVNREIATGLDFKVDFYYVTVGLYVNEFLFVYGTLSQLEIDNFGIRIDSIIPPSDTVYSGFDTKTKIDLPTVGFSYNLNNRITFKGQVLLADINEEWLDVNSSAAFNRFERNIDRYALAVSTYF